MCVQVHRDTYAGQRAKSGVVPWTLLTFLCFGGFFCWCCCCYCCCCFILLRHGLPLFLNLASHLGSLREPQRSICLCLLGAHANAAISGCSMWYYRSNIWSSSFYDKPYYSNTARSCFQFSVSFCASNPRGLGEKAQPAKCLPRKHDKLNSDLQNMQNSGHRLHACNPSLKLI